MGVTDSSLEEEPPRESLKKSGEHETLNLRVVGSSPTLGVFTLWRPISHSNLSPVPYLGFLFDSKAAELHLAPLNQKGNRGMEQDLDWRDVGQVGGAAIDGSLSWGGLEHH